MRFHQFGEKRHNPVRVLNPVRGYVIFVLIRGRLQNLGYKIIFPQCVFITTELYNIKLPEELEGAIK